MDFTPDVAYFTLVDRAQTDIKKKKIVVMRQFK